MDKGRRLDIVVLVLVGFFFSLSQAGAATFDVSTPAEFRTALNTAQGNNQNDVINVLADMNITSTLTYTGESTYTLIINGNGHYLDGGNSTKIMDINTTGLGSDSGSDITIQNLTFQHGSNPGHYGGGLRVQTANANFTLDSCAFYGNFAGFGGGAQVRITSARETLTNNTFNGNSAGNYGGGLLMHTYSDPATLSNNTFSGNSANYGGGVLIYSIGSSNIFSNNIFNGNSANLDGGGLEIFSIGSSNIFSNNIFNGNSAGNYGGGVYVYSIRSNPTFTNNSFYGNSANLDGGGAWTFSATSGGQTFTNNSFYGNSATHYGGGVSINAYDDNLTLNIYNNIIWNNTAYNGGNDGDDLYVNPDRNTNNVGCTLNLYNNNLGPSSDFTTGQSEDLFITVTSNYNHAGNILTDPMLANPAIGNFHLQAGSPCIDAGLNAAPGIPSTDFEEDPRIMHGTVDIGVDETPPVNLTVTKSGSGTGTATATGCTLAWSGNIGTCTASAGTAITLSATAGTGSAFGGWSAGTGSAASCSGTGDCTFNLSTNSTVNATFTLNQYTITETSGPASGGSVSCSPNPVDHGSTSTCTITANPGYTLQNVSGTCGGTLSENTYTTSSITADCTVQANFNLNQSVTVASATGNGDITIQTNSANCGLYNVSARSESDVGNDPDYDYPYGLVEFSLNCPQADVTITFPGDVSNMPYRKYGPMTPGDPSTTQWYTFPNVIVSGNQVTLHLQDGRLGDDTGVDGSIFDQGGPGQQGRVTVPTMNEWGTIVFMVLAGFVAVFYLRKRRAQ